MNVLEIRKAFDLIERKSYLNNFKNCGQSFTLSTNHYSIKIPSFEAIPLIHKEVEDIDKKLKELGVEV